ncbi:MAG: amidase family protein [Pseudomonas sp.]|uniref:amidase family protein n=1 Tax=Pseudomonas sp. TaxID=306 RepID=UPI003C7951A9
MVGIVYGVYSIIRHATQFMATDPPPPARPVPLGTEYAGVRELGEQMAKTGGMTSVDLVSFLLARIHRLNPQLNAVIEVNPEALKAARKLDQERVRGNVRGPLHGIPVLLKDTIETQGMQTSGGAYGLVGAAAGNDARIVQRLIEQGAVILGKTNLSELAGFRGGDRPAGWSSRGGQTRNPYKHDADVGGSSSGSAVALAAGFAPLAAGTETSGSIVVPAALNGVVGLKPSVGLLDRNGIIPASHRQDSPGPMARTVFDVALMLNAISGRDPHDPAGNCAPRGVDYTRLLVPGALKAKRIGYPVSFTHNGETESVVSNGVFTRVLEVLEEQGAILVPVDMRIADASRYVELLLGEVNDELNAYLAKRTGLPVKSLTELITFNQARDGADADHQPILKELSTSTLSREERSSLWDTLIEDFRDTVDAPIKANNLDAMVADLETNTYFAVAAAGYPGISVPCGMSEDDLPASAYFFGTRWAEATLLAVAHGYEQAAQAIPRPGL